MDSLNIEIHSMGLNVELFSWVADVFLTKFYMNSTDSRVINPLRCTCYEYCSEITCELSLSS